MKSEDVGSGRRPSAKSLSTLGLNPYMSCGLELKIAALLGLDGVSPC